jgi:hypothetical protein
MKKYLICLLSLAALIACKSCNNGGMNSEKVDACPDIFPDYTEVTVPSTIAPLNFTVNEKFDKIRTEIFDSTGNRIFISGNNEILIPAKKWKNILEANKGGKIHIAVSISNNDRWKAYKAFPVYVSDAPIDEGLAYRLIAPGYEIYGKMGIYYRNLSNFEQRALIENTLAYPSCMNCHSFKQTSADSMSLHFRGDFGGTLLQIGGRSEILALKNDSMIANAVYPYWHPTGKYIAYSANKTIQAFHAARDKRIEVMDTASDVIVYDVENRRILMTPLLKTENFETFPSFSPDGKTLYFSCAKKKNIPAEYNEIRYDLCSVDFDPTTGTFGNTIDTLIKAASTGKSASCGRPSYNGKYLMYTLSDYGNFPIWHKEADLWLLDLKTGETRELSEANSSDTESYHSWSSNSRWFVFGSRRADGLYTRPYIASIDENGRVGKPFLVPQKHTDYYRDLLYSFNIPEFVTGKIRLDLSEIEKKLMSKKRVEVF